MASERLDGDRYYTPHWVVETLLDTLRLDGVRTFLEPCAGDGRIVCALNARPCARLAENYSVELDRGQDYLRWVPPKSRIDLCITNPPYSLACEFISKIRREARCVWALLRVDFLGSQKRVPFWRKVGTPTHLLVLSKRPSFDNAPDATDRYNYAWFGWDSRDPVDSVSMLYPGIHIMERRDV